MIVVQFRLLPRCTQLTPLILGLVPKRSKYIKLYEDNHISFFWKINNYNNNLKMGRKNCKESVQSIFFAFFIGILKTVHVRRTMLVQLQLLF